jgi:hypothetical protein
MSAHPATEQASPHHGHGHRPHTPTHEEGPRRPWTVFAIAIAAQIMVILDVSVVNVALPSIFEYLKMLL